MSKMQGEGNTLRQYETLRLTFLVDPFTSLLPEVTESGMPLVVKSVSQRRTGRLLSSNIIEMVDPLSAPITASSSSVGIWNADAIQLENPHCRLFDTLSIANQGSFIIT